MMPALVFKLERGLPRTESGPPTWNVLRILHGVVIGIYPFGTRDTAERWLRAQ